MIMIKWTLTLTFHARARMRRRARGAMHMCMHARTPASGHLYGPRARGRSTAVRPRIG
jgi:hypothetical protein